MANIEAKQQIFLRLAAITAADVALVWYIVVSAVRDGISPDSSGFRRTGQPFAFWLSIGLVIFLGVGLAGAVAYAVLVSD